jgi:hypothetical protein
MLRIGDCVGIRLCKSSFCAWNYLRYADQGAVMWYSDGSQNEQKGRKFEKILDGLSCLLILSL